MVAKKLLHSFLVQWRAYYRSEPAKEYDPEWLWEMFNIYWNFLISILGADHELVQCNALQWRAYEIAIKKPESLWHRSRRSGKTLGMSHLAVFFAELEFGACHGKVVYRCPHVNQLKGLKQWLKQNPFYVKFRKTEYECDLFECKYSLDIACISESTNVGLECSVLIEDEYSTINKDDELYIWMLDTRAFLAKGSIESKRHFHGSSGRKNTPFEDDYLYLLEHDPSAIHVMPWTLCPWITKEFIEKEKKKMFDAAYWIEEQYECMWVMASGSFFDQNKLHVVKDDFFKKLHLKASSGGLDWNGAAVGHILGEGHYDGAKTIYIMNEEIFKSVEEVSRHIKEHEEINYEVEGKPMQMGFNAGFSDHLQTLNTPCSYQNWQEEGENIKDARLAILQRSDVYVHERCKWFIKNYKEASYDKKNKKATPQLKKTEDQHGLDYCLHLLHYGGDIDVITPQIHNTENESLDDMADIVRSRSRIF